MLGSSTSFIVEFHTYLKCHKVKAFHIGSLEPHLMPFKIKIRPPNYARAQLKGLPAKKIVSSTLFTIGHPFSKVFLNLERERGNGRGKAVRQCLVSKVRLKQS